MTYEQSREPLLDALDRLGRELSEAGDGPGAAQAAALARKLTEAQFQVVVMGEFKRGKSSLINALIGRPLLPVAASPLTSVVTVVRHGPAPRAFVEFRGGHRRETALGSIVDFVSEERNPKNEKRVERVVVETPAPFLTGGTLLVDTPGSGSVYRHNTEVSQKYLPEADAVILVLSADPPISQTEVEFLHSVRRWARKLFVVQNKVDYLEPADLDTSIAFTRRVLSEALGSPPSIFPLSAKLALQARTDGRQDLLVASGLPALEESLHALLNGNSRTALLAESVAARAALLIDQAVFDIDMRSRRAQVPVEEWARLSTELRSGLESAERRQFELATLYAAEIKLHLGQVEESIYTHVGAATKSVRLDLAELYRSIRSEGTATVREKLNAAFARRVEDTFSNLLADQERSWRSEFQSITDRYLDRTVGIVNQTLDSAAKALRLEVAPVAKPAIVVSAPSVWFVIDKVSIWTGGFGSLPTLRVFKPFFWKAIERKVGEAMDVNAGRLRHDYSQRLERAGEEASRAIRAFFGQCLSRLAKALPESAVQEDAARKQAARDAQALAARRQALLTLRRRFQP